MYQHQVETTVQPFNALWGNGIWLLGLVFYVIEKKKRSGAERQNHIERSISILGSDSAYYWDMALAMATATAREK